MKTLTHYINESTSSNFSKLFEIFRQNKLRGANTYDQINLPNNWHAFDMSIANNVKMLEASRCYWNAIQTSKETGADLCCGIAVLFNQWFDEDYALIMSNKNALVKPTYYVFPHAWNMLNNTIIDTTLKAASNYAYFGEIVNVNKFSDGSALMHYVQQSIR
jgi:hypothetical protein